MTILILLAVLIDIHHSTFTHDIQSILPCYPEWDDWIFTITELFLPPRFAHIQPTDNRWSYHIFLPFATETDT